MMNGKRPDRLSELINRTNVASTYEQISNAQLRRPLSHLRKPDNSDVQSNRQSLLTPQSNSRTDQQFTFIQPKDRIAFSRPKIKKQISEYGSRDLLKYPASTLPKTKAYLKLSEDEHQKSATNSLVAIAGQRSSLDNQSSKRPTSEKNNFKFLQQKPPYQTIESVRQVPSKRLENNVSDFHQEKRFRIIQQHQEHRVHTDGDASDDPHKINNKNKVEPQVFHSLPQPPMKAVCMILQSINQVSLPLDPSRYSTAKNGLIRNYAANTHQGLVRNYNEDRVSIIVNVNQGQRNTTPNCSYFAVYDGHGGCLCSDFLRDNLHLFVIRDENFPRSPILAIQKGFEQAENHFTQMCMNTLKNGVERSGSCAVSVMIVGDQCYVANVGDSRAIISCDGGRRVQALTRDHKPLDEVERLRIVAAGGRIYQSQIHQTTRRSNAQPQLGPHRVFPGRLSVTRSFGDIEAKLEQLGGKKGVVIAQPEIIQFKIQDNHDFILLASDGIFDKVTNEEIVQAVWETQAQVKQVHQLNQQKKTKIHEFGANAVENVMKFSLYRKTLDNITVVLVGFANFKRNLNLGKTLYKTPQVETKTFTPQDAKRTSFENSRDQQRLNFAIQI